MVLRGHLPADVLDRLCEGSAEVIVLVRREFRSLSVSVLTVEPDRFYPAGTWIRRVTLAIVP